MLKWKVRLKWKVILKWKLSESDDSNRGKFENRARHLIELSDDE